MTVETHSHHYNSSLTWNSQRGESVHPARSFFSHVHSLGQPSIAHG